MKTRVNEVTLCYSKKEVYYNLKVLHVDLLHPDDFNQLLIGCIETKKLQYEVLNAISDNRYKRLDISEAKEKVGYQPKADTFELFNLTKE